MSPFRRSHAARSASACFLSRSYACRCSWSATCVLVMTAVSAPVLGVQWWKQGERYRSGDQCSVMGWGGRKGDDAISPAVSFSLCSRAWGGLRTAARRALRSNDCPRTTAADSRQRIVVQATEYSQESRSGRGQLTQDAGASAAGAGAAAAAGAAWARIHSAMGARCASHPVLCSSSWYPSARHHAAVCAQRCGPSRHRRCLCFGSMPVFARGREKPTRHVAQRLVLAADALDEGLAGRVAGALVLHTPQRDGATQTHVSQALRASSAAALATRLSAALFALKQPPRLKARNDDRKHPCAGRPHRGGVRDVDGQRELAIARGQATEGVEHFGASSHGQHWLEDERVGQERLDVLRAGGSQGRREGRRAPRGLPRKVAYGTLIAARRRGRRRWRPRAGHHTGDAGRGLLTSGLLLMSSGRTAGTMRTRGMRRLSRPDTGACSLRARGVGGATGGDR